MHELAALKRQIAALEVLFVKLADRVRTLEEDMEVLLLEEMEECDEFSDEDRLEAIREILDE